MKGKELVNRVNQLEKELRRLDAFEDEMERNPFIVMVRRMSRKAPFYDQLNNMTENRGRVEMFDTPPDLNLYRSMKEELRRLKLSKQEELDKLINKIS